MLALLARRAPVFVSRRAFSTAAAPAGAKEVTVTTEIGAGLVLGVIGGGLWMLYAMGEFKKVRVVIRALARC